MTLLSVCIYGSFLDLQFGLSAASIISESTSLLSCGPPIISHAILSMFSNSMSCTPSNAGSTPEYYKEPTFDILMFMSYFNFTHVLVVLMFDLLYVFNMMV